PPAGRSTPPQTPGTPGPPSCTTFPRCSPWRCRRCPETGVASAHWGRDMGLLRRPGLVLGLVLLGAFASPAAAQIVPTAITFDILHAECQGAGNHQLTLSMNGHVLGSVPTGSVCYCDGSTVSATFSD